MSGMLQSEWLYIQTVYPESSSVASDRNVYFNPGLVPRPPVFDRLQYVAVHPVLIPYLRFDRLHTVCKESKIG